MTPTLLEQITRLLVQKGELFVQTDVDYRARAYLEVLNGAKALRPLGENGVMTVNPYGARSLREANCQEVGLPIYRLLFERL
jgi:tRNA (guanine-N7-)-methyltransferase